MSLDNGVSTTSKLWTFSLRSKLGQKPSHLRQHVELNLQSLAQGTGNFGNFWSDRPRYSGCRVTLVSQGLIRWMVNPVGQRIAPKLLGWNRHGCDVQVIAGIAGISLLSVYFSDSLEWSPATCHSLPRPRNGKELFSASLLCLQHLTMAAVLAHVCGSWMASFSFNIAFGTHLL